MSEAHGGKNAHELKSLGISAKDVVDLSANVSPFGTPPSVLKAIRKTSVAEYPDPHCTELRVALAKRRGIPAENILVGNGSTELIRLAAQAFARKGALIAGPTFAEYADACKGLGISFKEIRARGPGFMVDMTQWKVSWKPSAIFLCNPNNPTGVYLSQRDVGRLGSLFPGATFVIDEAFVDFAAHAWDSVRFALKRSVLLIRSMTKLYAMPGIRLGYAIGSREIIERLAAIQPTWSVSGPAQAAGLAALKEAGYAEKVIRDAVKNRTLTRKALIELGFDVVDSQTNFLLVKIGAASDFKKRLLLKHRILVRDCTSFGLPGYVRIAVSDTADCDRLVAAIGSLVRVRK